MKKLSVLLIVLVVLVFSLTACGGGDKNKLTVSEGDISTCLALNGPDVSAWTFTALEKAAGNVCWLYQRQLLADNQ